MAGHKSVLTSMFYLEQHSLGLSTSLLQDIVAGIALNLFPVCLLQKGDYWVKQRRTETKSTAQTQDPWGYFVHLFGLPCILQVQGSKSWKGLGSN